MVSCYYTHFVSFQSSHLLLLSSSAVPSSLSSLLFLHVLSFYCSLHSTICSSLLLFSFSALLYSLLFCSSHLPLSSLTVSCTSARLPFSLFLFSFSPTSAFVFSVYALYTLIPLLLFSLSACFSYLHPFSSSLLFFLSCLFSFCSYLSQRLFPLFSPLLLISFAVLPVSYCAFHLLRFFLTGILNFILSSVLFLFFSVSNVCITTLSELVLGWKKVPRYIGLYSRTSYTLPER